MSKFNKKNLTLLIKTLQSMRKKLKITFLMLVTVSSYGQLPHKMNKNRHRYCDSNKINYVDSLGNYINSIQVKLIYNGIKSICLDSLNDIDFIISQHPFFGIDSSMNYCVRCNEQTIKIVDSIDINHDGVKELFLFRHWNCFAAPYNLGPYGERGQQISCSKYEVWDVKSKRKLVEFKNSIYKQVAISTNVIRSSSCNIDVSINKNGAFILSNLSGDINWKIPEPGTYIYNNTTKTYKKE